MKGIKITVLFRDLWMGEERTFVVAVLVVFVYVIAVIIVIVIINKM